MTPIGISTAPRDGGPRGAAGGGYSLDCSRTQPDAKAANVLRLAKAGQTRTTIAADLGIGVASVDRILAEARATA
jgi:DNA invertase Pin-like site-specific DNA recombinase